MAVRDMGAELARAKSSARCLLSESVHDGDSVATLSTVGGASVTGELDIIESAVLELRGVLEEGGVDGLVVHALSWLDHLDELGETLAAMRADHKGDPLRVRVLCEQVSELSRRINALLRRDMDSAEPERAEPEGAGGGLAMVGDGAGGGGGGDLPTDTEDEEEEEESEEESVDARDLLMFQPEWGVVPGLLPGEQLALSRTWNVRVPEIERHSILRKLVLEGASLGVAANMMHCQVSLDARTFAKAKKLRVQRGNRADAFARAPCEDGEDEGVSAVGSEMY